MSPGTIARELAGLPGVVARALVGLPDSVARAASVLARAATAALALRAVTVAALAHGVAMAAAPVQFTPAGEIDTVREVRAVFGEPMVRLGEARAADPYDVDCPVAGRGRWVDPATWIWRFETPPPAGVRCTFSPRAGVRALSGAAPAGFTKQSVSTPGPAIVRSQPWEGSRIAEDQVFLLVLSGPAQPESVAQRAWCRVEGIGERVAVRLLAAAEQRELARRLEPGEAHVLAVACARNLPPKAKVALIWDSGIASPSGVASRRPQTLEFDVRDAFSATLSCTREQPNAPCSPLADLRLEFSAPVPRERALAARLRIGGVERAPATEGERDAPQLETVVFRGPLPESSGFVLSLPADLRDAEQRRLANAGQYPLAGRTAAFPPLAKFAAAPFGIIELDQAPAMPLALRRVERELLAAAGSGASRGSVRSLRIVDDASIIAWYAKVQRLHERALLPDDLRQALGAGAAGAAGASTAPGTAAGTAPTTATADRPAAAARRGGARAEPPPPVETRSVGLLAREPAARRLELPPPSGEGDWPFELIGVPLPEPGLHVLEIESPRLGRALLGRDAPMYVRTAALVTNLAVHYKQGLDNALVWVTSLDRGRPVAGAELRITDCDGKLLWQGRSDAQGIARVSPAPPPPAATCGEERPGHFVSARARDAQGRDDVSFAWSGWTQGIETWRFELPSRWERGGPTIAHTVFDRMLVRAGDTVSMKHYLRTSGSRGLARPAAGARLPETLRIVHEGSGQSWQQPLAWQAGSAVSSFRLPPGARLGRYAVFLETAEAAAGAPAPLWPGGTPSGSFRVEAFRQPVFDAKLSLPATLAPGAREAAADLRIGWFSGGAAGRLPVRVSARLNPHQPAFAGWEGYRFDRADLFESDGAPEGDSEAAARERAASRGVHRERLVLDKQALELDAQGAARVRVGGLPTMSVPHRLELEATFADPSGEIQSVARSTLVWPSQVVVGLRTESWAAAGGNVGLQVAVLDTAGRPLKERAVRVSGRLERTISHRKRLIGGLYAYENQRVTRELGELCRARTGASGVATCAITPRLPEGETGQLVLLASADDDAGRSASASTSVWIADRGELWFDAQAQDRIDLIPQKRRLAAGETARLQVRMPFRRATALVTVEREGILEARVVELRGTNPTVELATRPEWGPNVFVSVMPVRGRLREVPWYSLFSWGWRSPLDWWREYDGRGELPAARLAPTATVDLARPAFRLGITELALGAEGARLAVKVTPEREQVRVREQVPVAIEVRLPDGRTPAAGAQVAVAAVDEALLELLPNTSWQLLEAMMQRRSLDVDTASGQMHVVGKRHFGRKAVAAGGDGGRHPTRELFDTLLYWNPTVTLDARGQARVTVPVNDALTRFRIVAIADAGEGQFGTGEATIRSHQPLQLASGLPLAVREGDNLAGELTVRNNAAHPMTLTLTARARAEPAEGTEPANAAPALEITRSLTLAPGTSQAVALPLRVPDGITALQWQIEARETGGQRDALRLRQAVVPAVPLTVRQATLLAVEGDAGLALAAPAGALAGRSRVRVALAGGLAASSLAGVRDWLLRYPYGCLEQRASRALGLADPTLWQALVEELPAYVDRDGLAQFFPVRDGEAPAGSETLTAWLLVAAREAGMPLPVALRDTLLGGLAAWVEGRVRRDGWAQRADRSERRLAAMAALAAHGRLPLAQAAALDPAPERLPVSALLDWIAVLDAVPALPRRDALLAQADSLLRARLLASGTQLSLAERDDEPWWLLSNADAAHARLLLHALGREAWRADAPRLAAGLAGRQRQGAWSTTTANAWGAIAMRGFAARFEATRVQGRTRASLGAITRELDWERPPAPLDLPLPQGDGRLRLGHEGAGRPWAQVQVLAAVPLAQPVARGYQVTRTLEAVERREAGAWHRGDLVRVRITVQAETAMPWVVLADPLPPGATVLGSGLGREATLTPAERAEEGSRGERWPAPTYVERHPTAVHAYWERLPGGRRVFEYLMRLNQPGEFRLPPTRIEAMYQPDVHGESPNPGLAVRP